MSRALALALALVALGACGGDAAPRPLGNRADPDALIAMLHGVAALDEADAPRGLAAGVLVYCGDDCACLRPAIDEIAATTTCPAAGATVPTGWPPIELAGRYLAEQAAAAPAPGRARLLAAMAGVVIVIPRIDLAKARLAHADLQRPLSARVALASIDRRGARTDAAMPVARFDAQGAHVDNATPAPVRPPRSDPHASSTDLDYQPLYGDLVGYSQRLTALGRVGLRSPDDAPIVAADPAAPAAAVVEALARGGTLAIDAGGGVVRELPIGFAPGDAGHLAYELFRTQSTFALEVGVVEAGRWPIADDGSYDDAAVGAALARATPSPGAMAGVSIQNGTAAELIDTVALAIRNGAGSVQVVAEAPLGAGTSAPATGPHTSLGQPIAVGDLDKAIIRRYVKRQLAKITYCYEKRLLVKPDLEGTVDTEFYIAPSGEVASVTAHGVDAEVASCVAEVIKAISFPRPTGGGVQVRYPFRFLRAGP